MLACARIGAVHSVVPSAASRRRALAGRIVIANSEVLITADERFSGAVAGAASRSMPYAAAIIAKGMVKKMLVVRRTGADVAMKPKARDPGYLCTRSVSSVLADCPARTDERTKTHNR